MKLNELKPAEGSKRRKRRIGRGESSGWGKTAGRGSNGQKARSGASIKASFEGGQTPYFRRIPKRGFSNFDFKERFSIINVSVIEDRFSEGEQVTKEALIEKNIIKKADWKLKILGRGELSKAVKVVADKFSKSAIEKIEGAKGSVEVC